MTTPAPFSGAARHIAIVMHDFSTGGSERIAIRLANQWVRAGRQVTIMCGTIDGPARALVKPGVSVLALNPEIHRSALSRLVLGQALADPVLLLQPDLVFAPGNFHIPVVCALHRTLGREAVPMICKLSNPLHDTGRGAIGQAALDGVTRWSTRWVSAFVAMSASLRDEAIAVLRRKEVIVIPEPNVDNDPAPSSPPAGGGTNGPLILCAGRLVRQKNFQLAIQAFARLDPEIGAHLLILGEGEDRAALQTTVEHLGFGGRITLAGHVADIRPFLANARLFLMASRYEGYPAVLIEALAAGVPIVTTDCTPALGEIMAHPSFGRIVGADAGVLARAMEEGLAAARPDAAAVAALLERHGIDQVAARYLDLFDQTVAAHHVEHDLVPAALSHARATAGVAA